MLSKRTVVSVALGFALLSAGLHAAHAGARYHQDVLLSYNAGHRVKFHQVHPGSIRSHGFHGHHRYYSHRPGYGMAAVGLGILGGGILGAAIAHAGTPVVVNPAPVVYSHPLVITSSVPQQTLVVDQVQTMAPAYGSVYSALPAGCSLEQVQAQNYYRCGSYWYLPQLGPQGVQYMFVTPRLYFCDFPI